MKAKGFLKGLGLLIVILFIVSFFLPKNMNLEHKETLEASPEQLFYQVNNIKNWQKWSPWFEMDKDMKVEYSEKTAGVDANYKWESEKKYVGNGKMLIDESIQNEKIGTSLLFEGSDGGFADFYLKPSGSGTEVIWDFSSDYKAKFWQRYNTAFGRLMLKNSFKKGLKNLEAYIAAHPDEHIFENPHPEIEIKLSQIDEFNAISTVREGKWDEFGSPVYASGYGELMGKIMENQLEMNGQPFAKWIEWDTTANHFKLELGIPVKTDGEKFGGVDAIKANYYGDYNGMDKAYIALEAYGIHHGCKMGMPYEFFITDSTTEPDTSKWLTEVYFPIE